MIKTKSDNKKEKQPKNTIDEKQNPKNSSNKKKDNSSKKEKQPIKSKIQTQNKKDKENTKQTKDENKLEKKEIKDGKSMDKKQEKAENKKSDQNKKDKKELMDENKKSNKPKLLKTKKMIYAKSPKPLTYIDEPDKSKIPNKYIHGIVQLDRIDPLFTDRKFQKIRHVSLRNNVVLSFHRIGMCLNKIDVSTLPKKTIKKVLFILITENNDVGCFNDAYIISLIHIRLGFKIVYLYNTNLITLIKFLGYFLQYTINSFTFYYSGDDSASKIRNIGHGIKFIDKNSISDKELGQFIAQKSNGKEYILVLSDCASGGSVFDMESAINCENKSLSDIVSFASHKSQLTPDEKVRSHGLFTYYFCKIIHQFPTSSPEQMVEKLDELMKRFKISFSYETSEKGTRISDDIIFEDADTALNGPNAEITGPNKRKKIPEPKHEVETMPIPIEFQGN